MKFYHIKDDYLDYLHTCDPTVALNKQEKRPYVGVVLDIDGCKFYVPLTSPKDKHKNMKNTRDFRKINGGVYGAVNLNNMVPVVESALMEIDIQHIDDVRYRRLLQNQYTYVSRDFETICALAKDLYRLVCKDDSELSEHDRDIKSRCCDFTLLEHKCLSYKEVKITEVHAGPKSPTVIGIKYV